MIFRYYFLKEGTRVYDKSELLTYLQANKYIKINNDGPIKKAIYHNPLLNLDATFVFNNKSIISNIDRLNPKYLDLNIYVEIPVLTNTYKVDRLVDIIRDICNKFDFAVYNEYFEDVSPFDRNLLIAGFNLVKRAYKKKYEEEFVTYSRLSEESLGLIYTYLENKDAIENEYHAKSLDYIFLREKETRQAYVCVDLDFEKAFIIPPAAKLVRYRDDKLGYVIISFEQFIKKISKYCEIINYQTNASIYKIEDRACKKINKVLTKTNFDKVVVPLNEISLDSILDL